MDNYETEIIGDRGYIKVGGELNTEEAGELLLEAFQLLYDKGQRTIVVDLSNVAIINSYGIGKIVSCFKRLRADNGTFVVKSPQGFVKETFEILMLDKILTVEG